MELKSLLKNYSSKWVALSPDEKEILVSDTTMAGLFKQIEKLDEKEPHILFVPPADSYLVPNAINFI